jgi:hypothetical protein
MSHIQKFALSVPFAVIGGVCMLAPSAQAATFRVNGFTDAFAPAEWTIENNSGGATTISATEATLTTTTQSGSVTSFTFDTNDLANTYPNFAQGTVTFNWDWTSTNTPFFDSFLEYQINGSNPVSLTRYVGPTPPTILDVANIDNFVVSANNVSFNVVAGDSFLFRLTSASPSFAASTATISSFSFIGSDGGPDPVPAPIPILGAAAAFGFGRRIRRRLATSGSMSAS